MKVIKFTLIFFMLLNLLAPQVLLADEILQFQKKRPTTITAFGDLMLDRGVRETIKRKGATYPLKDIKKIISESDIAIANLEGPFTTAKSIAIEPNDMRFTFDPGLAPQLKSDGFDLFNLANNHTLNFGRNGLAQTKKYLVKNKLEYFGDPKNNTGISYVKEVNGTKIGFVGYDQLDGGKLEPVLREIKQLKSKVDFIIAYTHWGAEYKQLMNARQKKEARQLIDSGADVIIGTHPHVIQPIEIYKNKAIFYSLGNFLFDQSFSEATKTGLGVKMTINGSSTTYSLMPLYINKEKVTELSGKKRQAVLTKMAGGSIGDGSIIATIKSGEFKLSK
jgi:gamma-polyglutamate biosynthesis protein CapA